MPPVFEYFKLYNVRVYTGAHPVVAPDDGQIKYYG